MENTERLKRARDLMLRLHEELIDGERSIYESIHGPLNAGQFLNVLLENEDFAWLRKFSMLIVEIDELFDLKDGMTGDMVIACLDKATELIEMREAVEEFNEKYRISIQRDASIAGMQAELRTILSGG